MNSIHLCFAPLYVWRLLPQNNPFGSSQLKTLLDYCGVHLSSTSFTNQVCNYDSNQAQLNYLCSLLWSSGQKQGWHWNPTSRASCTAELVTLHRGGWDPSSPLSSATVISTVRSVVWHKDHNVNLWEINSRESQLILATWNQDNLVYDPYLPYKREFLTNTLQELCTDSQRKQEMAINKWLRIMTPPLLGICSL